MCMPRYRSADAKKPDRASIGLAPAVSAAAADSRDSSETRATTAANKSSFVGKYQWIDPALTPTSPAISAMLAPL